MASARSFGMAAGPATWPRPRSAPDPRALAEPVVLRTQRARDALSARGIESAGDLLETVPRAYRDYSEGVEPISGLRVGVEGTVRGIVERVDVRQTGRRNLVLVKARLADESGQVDAVWFNQRYLGRALQPGQVVQARGEARAGRGGLELTVREHEILADEADAIHTEGLVPVYDANRALSTRTLHELVEQHVHRADAMADPLPTWLRIARDLPSRRDAIRALHDPSDLKEPSRATARLAYEELLLLQLALLERRRRTDAAAPAVSLGRPSELERAYLEGLPFALTVGQRRSIRDIDRDLLRTRPMRRLLIGDVGSGKTAVAVHAMLRAVGAGGQAALLAPTETLAQQHAATVRSLVEPLGLEVDLVTSDLPAGEKRARRLRIASGDSQLVVGTHALLEREVEFSRLLLVVVDEQHRFGVEQRAALVDAHGAHALHMTATPIPRSLALSLYGDLDVTELRDLPHGRLPIKTRRVSEAKREDCHRWVVEQWNERGEQTYVVCALVDGGETAQARAAADEHEHLQRVLEPLQVGLVHGRMRGADKAAAMRAFAERRTQVLVATTVIEVGVDVPNATAIVIEDADRFGLSQLHQLRGRVGRGLRQSYCFLFESREPTPLGTDRLEALVSHSSGFDLAEMDLRMRGEGELAGLRQAGRSDLRHAILSRHRRIAAAARADARLLERRGLIDPVLRAASLERFGDLLDRLGRA